MQQRENILTLLDDFRFIIQKRPHGAPSPSVGHVREGSDLWERRAGRVSAETHRPSSPSRPLPGRRL